MHENLSVARVGDLALKVALEKALGNRIVSLGEDSIAFPQEAVAEVKRIVAKMGHVVKEVAHREFEPIDVARLEVPTAVAGPAAGPPRLCRLRP